jgi:signal transduction histidine kinase
MKKIFSSFYARLSAVFLILLLLMGAVQMFISMNSSINFMKEADQRMNTNLAAAIALEFEPFIKDSIDMPGIEHMMHYLMVLNPHIEIYLLDSAGAVMAFFAEPDKKVKRDSVSLETIHSFLEAEKTVPIHGDDPRNPDRKKPFSVASARINNEIDGYIYIILGGEQYDAASDEIREGFMMSTVSLGLLISVAFTAIIGLVLFFFMTNRLRSVTNVVVGFKDGNYKRRLPEKSTDDLGQLSKSFNQMADTIVSNMDELKNTDSLRRELIANVSHDLRSPLASIQGYLETILMKMDSMSIDELKKYLKISLDNSNHLSHLIAELFELSKLDAHQIEPHRELFSISELIQDGVMKFKPHAEAKSITLESKLGHELPLVKADISMIDRVLSNLLENAIEYTPENGKVSIESGPKNGNVLVTITDSGPGISSEDIPNIFARYYRANRSGKDRKTGSGLGLAIAKKMLELHGSDIKVNSEIECGTTFYFELSTYQSGVVSEQF